MQWQPAQGTQPLSPFDHQVAGQSSMLRYDKTTVCKPLIAREHFVYKSLPPDLAEFTPEYRGEIEVQLIEEDGYIQLYGLCVDDEADVFPGTPENHSHEIADMKSVKSKEISMKARSTVRLLRSGSYEVSASTNQVFYAADSKPDQPHTQSLNPWSLKNHKRLLDKMRKSEHSHDKIRFILLKNVVADFRHPCILDLKIGSRLHGDEASSVKVSSQSEKCRMTTSSSLGVRLCGMQVYQVDANAYHSVDKYHGRTLNEVSFKKMLYDFLHNGTRFRSELIQPIVSRLSELIKCLEHLHSFRFYASSLLIIYDGDVGVAAGHQETKVQESKPGITAGHQETKVQESKPGITAGHQETKVQESEPGITGGDQETKVQESKSDITAGHQETKVQESKSGITGGHQETKVQESKSGITAGHQETKVQESKSGITAGHQETKVQESKPGITAGHQETKVQESKSGITAGHQETKVLESKSGITAGHQETKVQESKSGITAGHQETKVQESKPGITAGHQETKVQESKSGITAGHQETKVQESKSGITAGHQETKVQESKPGITAGHQETKVQESKPGITAGHQETKVQESKSGITAGHQETKVQESKSGITAGHQETKVQESKSGITAGHQETKVQESKPGITAGHQQTKVQESKSGITAGHQETKVQESKSGITAGHQEIKVQESKPGITAGHQETKVQESKSGITAGHQETKVQESKSDITAGHQETKVQESKSGITAGHQETKVQESKSGITAGLAAADSSTGDVHSAKCLVQNELRDNLLPSKELCLQTSDTQKDHLGSEKTCKASDLNSSQKLCPSVATQQPAAEHAVSSKECSASAKTQTIDTSSDSSSVYQLVNCPSPCVNASEELHSVPDVFKCGVLLAELSALHSATTQDVEEDPSKTAIIHKLSDTPDQPLSLPKTDSIKEMTDRDKLSSSPENSQIGSSLLLQKNRNQQVPNLVLPNLRISLQDNVHCEQQTVQLDTYKQLLETDSAAEVSLPSISSVTPTETHAFPGCHTQSTNTIEKSLPVTGYGVPNDDLLQIPHVSVDFAFKEKSIPEVDQPTDHVSVCVPATDITSHVKPIPETCSVSKHMLEVAHSCGNNVKVDVKMIDFAHTTHQGFTQDKIKHVGPDTDYIFGLRNLLNLFQELLGFH